MPKDLEIIGPEGDKINVSKWLKPLNQEKDRSDRPKITVDELEDEIIYSLPVNLDEDGDIVRLQYWIVTAY